MPPQYLCPITGEVMEDPVTTADGHAYERAAIAQWLLRDGGALEAIVGTHRVGGARGRRLERTKRRRRATPCPRAARPSSMLVD